MITCKIYCFWYTEGSNQWSAIMNQSFPNLPGIYFFKNGDNVIIYVGKAANLKERLRTYFQRDGADLKVSSIMQEYETLDYIVTMTETEALLLEARMIQEHQPKFNVLLKDGQPFVYLLFTAGALPEFKIVRNKKQKGCYFGPFLQKSNARKMHSFLINTFRLKLCNLKIEQGCLNYHLGLCAGNCKQDFAVYDYLFRIGLAQHALTDNQKEFKEQLQEKITQYNQTFEFEKARNMVEILRNADHIFRVLKIKFNEFKYLDKIAHITAPKQVAQDFSSIGSLVAQFLSVDKTIRTIDCFDISHFQSQSIVGSCIRFTDGKPEKNKFRRFKIQSLQEQNDYAALQEIVSRRYKDRSDIPDLILIDGGKGQLNSVKDIVPGALFISLAKREETVYQVNDHEGKKLDIHDSVGKLLIALRDYAHHFAITYHRKKRSGTFTGKL